MEIVFSGESLFNDGVGVVLFVLGISILSTGETPIAALGGYALADRLHFSGPLAMVAVGLIVGNHGRASAMSHVTRQHVDMF